MYIISIRNLNPIISIKNQNQDQYDYDYDYDDCSWLISNLISRTLKMPDFVHPAATRAPATGFPHNGLILTPLFSVSNLKSREVGPFL